ncbi:MAG: fluoride efflux transporter CrcB [Muribaculaceae bacterium]|nr:fluoride efflux transporter CrcB [Muribaculaceae bacterium]
MLPIILKVACVAAGGAIGCVARYLTSLLIGAHTGGNFPWATLTVNVAGCLIIGLISGTLSRYEGVGEHVRLFLTVGLCGGFTTFSTFANENWMLLDGRHFIAAAAYCSLSLLLGLAAVYAGYRLAGA